MKTYINAPTDIEIKRLVAEALQEGDNPLLDWWNGIIKGVCDGITTVGEDSGCKSDGKPPSLVFLCDIINGFLSAVGCEPIPVGDAPECINDPDCQAGYECTENVCVLEPPPECTTDNDCMDYQNCTSEECVDDFDHCHFTGCESYEECDGESGDCELTAGKCESDPDCTWDLSKDICKVSEHECVECLQDPDCSGDFTPGGVCKDPPNTCVQCEVWQDCGEGYDCNLEVCEECIPQSNSCNPLDDQCCSGTFCHETFETCEPLI